MSVVAVGCSGEAAGAGSASAAASSAGSAASAGGGAKSGAPAQTVAPSKNAEEQVEKVMVECAWTKGYGKGWGGESLEYEVKNLSG